MTRIFMSYSRQDEGFARRLASTLDPLGTDIWIDKQNIPPGMKWSKAIQQALETCDVMILILSPDSIASSNVEDEWNYFHTRGKTIIPILLRTTAIPYQLERAQYIDFREPTPGYAAGYAELVKTLKLNKVATPIPSATVPKNQAKQKSTPDGRLNAIAIIAAAIITVVGAYLLSQANNRPVSSALTPTDLTSTPISTGIATSTASATIATTNTPTEHPTLSPTFTADVATQRPTEIPATPILPTTVPTTANVLSTNLSVERSPDGIAICGSSATVRLSIGTNESYSLIEYFPAPTLETGKCVCLQRVANTQFTMPAICQPDNTRTVSGNDWRNQSITLEIDGAIALTCKAQPQERQPFRCPR